MRAGLVLRPVVDDDDLEMGMVLGEHRREGGLDVLRFVPRSDDDADRRGAAAVDGCLVAKPADTEGPDNRLERREEGGREERREETVTQARRTSAAAAR